MKKIIFIANLLLLSHYVANAQSNLRYHAFALRDTIVLNDSLTIIPQSLQLFSAKNDTIPASFYSFFQKKIIFNKKILSEKKLDTVIFIKYRVLPFHLEKSLTHLDSSLIQPSFRGDDWQFKPNKTPNSEILPTGKDLNYSGGLSRAISVGNNQDLVLNSNFNLQMSGKLSNDIEVTAAMSDNNIPIQPDGNTAQLNQFDRIFIQLKRKETQLNAGDFDLTRPESYFVNYYKRVQGLGVQHVEKFKDKGTWTTKVTGAVSRGKFARQIIQGSEGNQGPYRLQGGEGERFIIIISGTEKIYIDGILLKRGYDNDYVMDYNQGVLTFSNKRLITKDSRITAEFEYNDQSFVRSLYAVSSEYKSKYFRLHFNLYGEQDGRSSGQQQDLSQQDKIALANGGDSNNIFSEGVDSVGFTTNRILYKKEFDPSGNRYFKVSQNKDSAYYALRFLEVPLGTGDYTVKLSAANGRVFEYVGIGNGDYKLGTKLTTPKLFQMYSFGADYQLFKKKNALLKAEITLSNNDNNRLSELDKKDDIGLGTLLSYRHSLSLKKKWKLHIEGVYEGIQQNFKVLNPYRAIEFKRDWNNDLTQVATENLLRGNINLAKDSLGFIGYDFNYFGRKLLYEGFKNTFNFGYDKKTWSATGTYSILQTNANLDNSLFVRPKLDIKKVFKDKSNVGIYIEKESNKRWLADTLSRLSFDYQIAKAYWQMSQRKGLNLGVFAQQRIDFLPKQNELLRSSTANELNINGAFRNKNGVTVNGNIAYRKLNIDNKELTNLQAQETYLGAINAAVTKLKGAFFTSSSYEVGSGQEQRIEYYYQKVQVGLGNLSWRDYNKDDVIQQDEVFPAVFQDSANIVRFVLPTNQFIRTNNLTFNQLLNLNPKLYWNKNKGFKKAISLFATESAWQIQNKVKIGAAQSAWNPFISFEITDTALVAATTSQRHTLYLNKNSQTVEASIGKNDNFIRSLLTSGYDIRGQEETFLRGRWNISKQFTSKVALIQNTKKSESEFFPLRNYLIYTRSIEPELNILPNRNFRYRLSYKYANSLDTLKGREQAIIHDFSNELSYNYKSKTSIRAKATLVNINYEGATNTPVQYVMLNALQAGKNYLWSLQLNQALNKTLQLEIRYDGRKTGISNRIVHTGNMAVRALF